MLNAALYASYDASKLPREALGGTHSHVASQTAAWIPCSCATSCSCAQCVVTLHGWTAPGRSSSIVPSRQPSVLCSELNQACV
jgi:hypothetical protein